MSDSVRPCRRQPTRLHCPWDSPGKNTGVGCHFLLQCIKVKSESEVAKPCPTLSDPTDCSPPGSSAHGIFQARLLEWGAITFYSCFIARASLITQLVRNLPAMQETQFNSWIRKIPWRRDRLPTPVFGSAGKDSACNAGDQGSIPGLGRSPGEGNGNHSSILAWEIPWTEEPGTLQSMGSQRAGQN